MSTITNYNSYILYESTLGKRVLIKPFSVVKKYETNHLTITDAYNNQHTVNADDLTGFTFTDVYDLINQLLVLSTNGDILSTVNVYADLPAPATLPNRFFFVRVATGTKWLPGGFGGTYYPNGTYYSDGVAWLSGVDIYTAIQKITGTVTIANPTAAITGYATSAKQDILLTELQLKADLTETQPVSVASLPLPSGAATAANQQTNALTDAQIRLTPLPISGTVSTGLSQGLTDTQLRATPVPVTMTGGGDATAANQTAGNASLSSIDGKTPALGQALAASSTPVVLTAAQLSTLTPPAAITGFALAANQQTNAITDAQIRATALPVSGAFFQATQPVSLASTTITGSVAVTGGLTDTQIRATPLPVSGTVAVSNMIVAVETGLAKDVSLGSLTEAAPATDTASSGLNGRLQRVAQRITSLITALGSPFQAGGSIGNTSFGANAGTNLNTSALNLETTQALIKAKTDNIPAQGQALAAASLPVVLTATQITTLTPVAAITGFNLEATQLLVKAKTDNLDVLLSTRLSKTDFEARINTLGQKTSANSTPVVIASDQTVTIALAPTTTSTHTTIVASVTVQTFLAANVNRKGVTLYCLGTTFIKLGTGATTTVFTIRIAANGYYEVPFSYTGIITGIWSSASGNAIVAELT